VLVVTNSPLNLAVLFVRVVTGICQQNCGSTRADSVTPVVSDCVRACFFLTRIQRASVYYQWSLKKVKQPNVTGPAVTMFRSPLRYRLLK